MAEAGMSLPVVRRFGETARRDPWWVQPAAVFMGLSAFIVYATWAAFQGDALPLRALPVAVLLAGVVRRLGP